MKLKGTITDVPGIRVGHWSENQALTGCTVILLPPGTRGGVDTGSCATATRETDVLEPHSRIDEVHALVFTGGSAYGLDSAGGVMRFLEKRGIGHKTSCGIVPIVPAAAIYDLATGNPAIRPGVREGEIAAENASKNFETGRVGAGTGATCGKLQGIKNAVPAGIGTASIKYGKVIVGALAVVNPVGNIIDEQGKIILGTPSSKFKFKPFPQNTVLVAVATNCKLDKLQCFQTAMKIRDGITRSINPAHTKHDGDAGFFFSCGNVKVDLDIIFNLTVEVTASAIRSTARFSL